MADVSIPQARDYYRVRVNENGAIAYANNIDLEGVRRIASDPRYTVEGVEHIVVSVTVIDVTAVFGHPNPAIRDSLN